MQHPLISRAPGRKVRRAQMRKSGTFRANARATRQFIRSGGYLPKPGEAPAERRAVVNSNKSRALAGKARRRARLASQMIAAGV